MSSDPRFVQNALHEEAVLPGNFNPANGKWEGSSKGGRTKLVFDPKTKKFLALNEQQAEAAAAKRVDEFFAVDLARAGIFILF